GEVPAPEDDAGHSRGEAREQAALERVPGGALVARPMRGIGLCPRIAGAREADAAILLGEAVVGGDVVARVAVAVEQTVGAIGEDEIPAPHHLAAIGLEPVDAEIVDQILPLAEPPIRALTIGEV